jgi:FkbM family methyltransferase
MNTELPLFRRGYHFLRKAGLLRFTIKMAYWLRLYFDRTRTQRGKQSESRFYDRISQLPCQDGHVTIPVLDFKMKVRANDPGLSKELVLAGGRELDAVYFLRPYLARCETILEIGANQGYYLIQEALHSPEHARIYAFEPHPENVKTAALNLALNGVAAKCKLVEGAISDTGGQRRLNVSQRSNWHTLGPSNQKQLEFSGESLDVQAFSIDGYTSEVGIDRVDLIRMDVEGHEIAVIRGAVQTIQRSPKILIFLEFHTSLIRQAGESPEQFLSDLRNLGLRCVAVCGNGKYLRNPTWDTLIKGLELITTRYGTHMFFSNEQS